MLNLVSELKLNSSIINISILKDYILMMDNFYNIYIVDKDSFKLIKNIKLMRVKKSLHEYTKSMASSIEGYLATPDKRLDSIMAFQLEDDYFINKLFKASWHTSKIEVSKFSYDSKYLATGGADGKVFIFQLPEGEVLTSLPNRPDFIASIDFSKNDRLIAISSYDKTSLVFDIKRNVIVRVFKTKGVVENLKFFNKAKKIFFVTRCGASGVYDLIEKKVNFLNNHFNSWPTSISITEDEKFAIIGSRKNDIYAVRLEDNIKVLDVSLDNNGVSNVRIFKESIIIAFIDGSVQIYDFNKHTDELKKHLDRDDFKNAKEILKKNIFLTIHPFYKKFDEVWPDILQESIKLLSDERIEDAVELVAPFVDDPKKEKQFNIYLIKKDLVKEFLELVEKEDFKNAYILVQNKQYLQHTDAYKKLENRWLAIFNRAKKLLEEDATINKKSAQEMLKPFMAIQEKANIAKALLVNPSIFKNSENYIKKQNFKAYFTLVKKHSFLKDSDLYNKTINLANILLTKMVDFENEEKFDEAKKVAKTLINFATHTNIVKAKLFLIDQKKKLIQAIENKNLEEVYNLVLEYPALSSLSVFQRLEDKFNDIFEDVLKDAFRGDPSAVLSELAIYLKLKYWSDKIASILKVGYIQEFKYNKDKYGVNWEESIKNYLIRFGIDGEIEKVCEEFELNEILEKLSDSVNPTGYKSQIFLETLLVFDK